MSAPAAKASPPAPVRTSAASDSSLSSSPTISPSLASVATLSVLSRRARSIVTTATPSRGRSTRSSLLDGTDIGADVIDDVLRRRTRRKDLCDAELLELRDVLVRNDASAEQDHVVEGLRAHELEDARKERHMRAREDREADTVDVFLNSGGDDLLRRLPKPRVDDLHPSVAQSAGNDFRAAVMPVEPGLCDEYAYFSFHRGPWSVSREP